MKHLEESEISLFIQGKLDAVGEDAVTGHLRDCDQCRREYNAAILMNWFWRRDRASTVPDPGPPGAAAGAGGTGAQRGPEDPGRRAVPGRRRRRGGKYLVLGTVAAVMAVVGWWWFGTGPSGLQAIPGLEPVVAGATAVSNRTDFVLPGTEFDFVPASPVYRSSGRWADPSIDDTLIHLTDKRVSGRASRDEMYWLAAGFVAVDQLDEAAIVAADALERYPGDADLLSVAAVIACMDGDVTTSERLLREALGAEPADPVARVNLAVILLKTDRVVEAASLLDDVIGADPDSRLAQRARRLLP